MELINLQLLTFCFYPVSDFQREAAWRITGPGVITQSIKSLRLIYCSTSVIDENWCFQTAWYRKKISLTYFFLICHKFRKPASGGGLPLHLHMTGIEGLQQILLWCRGQWPEIEYLRNKLLGKRNYFLIGTKWEKKSWKR